MDDWLKGVKHFAISEQLMKKHQEIKDITIDILKIHLKGPNEFKEHFLTQLQKVL